MASNKHCLRREFSQVPVTALAFCCSSTGRLLILSGEDTDIKVFDAESSRPVSQLKVLHEQPIHGLSVQQDASSPSAGRILVWGARSVAVVSVEGLDSGKPTVLAKGTAPDWIYHGMLSPYDSTTLVFATAHNEVVQAEINSQAAKIGFKYVVSPARPILYSAELAWLAEDSILMAGGTVFGQVFVWKCRLGRDSKGSEEILFVLEGHEGSIHGVTISPILQLTNGKSLRLLASCSDDRTIRIWDITDGAESASSFDKGSFNIARETGFSVPVEDQTQHTAGSVAPIAVAMGHHLSRIWNVRFSVLDDATLENDTVYIYSFGEDSTTQKWLLSFSSFQSANEQPSLMGSLTHRQAVSPHDGKHIWSQAICSWKDSLLLATGGSDNKISLMEESSPRRLNMASFGARDISTAVDFRTVEFSDVCKTDNLPKQKAGKPDIIWQYDFISPDELLMTTTHGRLFRGSFQDQNLLWSELVVDDTLKDDLKKAYVIRRCPGRTALLGTGSGNLYYLIRDTGVVAHVHGFDKKITLLKCFSADSEAEKSLHVLVGFMGTSALAYLIFNRMTGAVEDQRVLLGLDPRFVIASASKVDGLLIIGSRHGWMSVLRLEEKNYVGLVHMTPRSNDAITSIIPFPSRSGADGSPCFVTTSRDGRYRIYQIEYEAQNSASLRLVHEASPPFGPMIEGGWFTDGPSPELILYGFRSKNFVVWNETLREERMFVDCGGAHRIFNFHHENLDAGKLRLAFTRKSALLIYSQNRSMHRAIRSGTHGREIRTLASSGTLIASGSEDTTIRLSQYNEGTKRHLAEMRCRAQNKVHTAGLQKVKWPRLHSNCDFLRCPDCLFSSSGNEEFVVWRVRQAEAGFPGPGMVCEASFDDRTKDGDLRILDFDVTCIPREEGFCIIMAFSDSTLAAYTYTSRSGFQLIVRSLYTGACLTHAFSLGTLEDGLPTITASTDGHFVIWRLLETEDQKKQWSIQKVVNVHQNSIKCMHVAERKGRTRYTVVTGGDDNALGVTTLDARDYHVISQRIIKNAHTASINGIGIVEREDHLLALTAGNDQRIKLWSLIDGEKTSIELLADEYSGVADTSDLTILEGGRKAMICGVGTEVWTLCE